MILSPAGKVTTVCAGGNIGANFVGGEFILKSKDVIPSVAMLFTISGFSPDFLMGFLD